MRLSWGGRLDKFQPHCILAATGGGAIHPNLPACIFSPATGDAMSQRAGSGELAATTSTRGLTARWVSGLDAFGEDTAMKYERLLTVALMAPVVLLIGGPSTLQAAPDARTGTRTPTAEQTPAAPRVTLVLPAVSTVESRDRTLKPESSFAQADSRSAAPGGDGGPPWTVISIGAGVGAAAFVLAIGVLFRVMRADRRTS